MVCYDRWFLVAGFGFFTAVGGHFQLLDHNRRLLLLLIKIDQQIIQILNILRELILRILIWFKRSSTLITHL